VAKKETISECDVMRKIVGFLNIFVNEERLIQNIVTGMRVV